MKCESCSYCKKLDGADIAKNYIHMEDEYFQCKYKGMRQITAYKDEFVCSAYSKQEALNYG